MFNQTHLEELGFAGFVPLLGAELASRVPSESGVYVVLADAGNMPTFLDVSLGGRFKGRNPTVDPAVLASKFVRGSEALYIGRATKLNQRVGLLARFGRGEPVAHWGGRYLWQIDRPESLRVAWRLEADPVEAEALLLDQFEVEFGRLPFANLVRGNRSRTYA